MQSNITGVLTYYSGGGDGGFSASTNNGTGGGLGGGGVARSTCPNPYHFNGNSSTYYGSGGAGGCTYQSGRVANGGNGYVGLVILRYATQTAPTASFSVNNSSGVFPQTVVFTDTSTNTPTSWVWNFTNVTGNNTAVTFSTSKNVTYTFGVGNWSIRLNTSNTAGNNISVQTTFINVSDAGITPPVASFTTSRQTIRTPQSVTMTDTSTNTPTSWSYNWGDGSANSTTQNPSHVYYKRGVWNVTLTATNAGGSNVSAVTQIRVLGYETV